MTGCPSRGVPGAPDAGLGYAHSGRFGVVGADPDHPEVQRRCRTTSRINLAGIRAYQQAIGELAALSNMDVWYVRVDVNGVIQRWGGGVDARRSG